MFLDLNGVFVTDPQGRLYDGMIALAERRASKADLAMLLRELASGS